MLISPVVISNKDFRITVLIGHVLPSGEFYCFGQNCPLHLGSQQCLPLLGNPPPLEAQCRARGPYASWQAAPLLSCTEELPTLLLQLDYKITPQWRLWFSGIFCLSLEGQQATPSHLGLATPSVGPSYNCLSEYSLPLLHYSPSSTASSPSACRLWLASPILKMKTMTSFLQSLDFPTLFYSKILKNFLHPPTPLSLFSSSLEPNPMWLLVHNFPETGLTKIIHDACVTREGKPQLSATSLSAARGSVQQPLLGRRVLFPPPSTPASRSPAWLLVFPQPFCVPYLPWQSASGPHPWTLLC